MESWNTSEENSNAHQVFRAPTPPELNTSAASIWIIATVDETNHPMYHGDDETHVPSTLQTLRKKAKAAAASDMGTWGGARPCLKWKTGDWKIANCKLGTGNRKWERD